MNEKPFDDTLSFISRCEKSSKTFLSKTDENKLISIFQKDEKGKLKDRIFKVVYNNNIGFCMSYVKRYSDEYLQEYKIIIFKSMKTFNPEYDFKFATFLGGNLRGLRSRYNPNNPNIISLDGSFNSENGIDNLEYLVSQYMNNNNDCNLDIIGDLQYALLKLDSSERSMIDKWHSSDYNYAEMGKNQGVTRQCIHQNMNRIFEKLRFYLKNPNNKLLMVEKLNRLDLL